MKIHSIELQNWRKFKRKRIEFDKRTTVIYGPNETGKSTILEGLSRCFFDRSSSKAEEIKRITPLSALGAISSKVAVKFALDGKEYFVDKAFNHNRATYLYKIENSEKILLAQDEDAHRILIDLLEADLQTSRASKPSKWGAFYWLWSPQNNRELPSEGDPTSSLHLDQSGGAVLVTQKFHSVQELVKSKYLQFFTRTGKYKIRSTISETEEELDLLKIENEKLNLRISNVDDYKRELQDRLRELPKHGDILTKSKTELEKARDATKDYEKIESELSVIIANLKITQRNIEDALKAIEELQKSSDNIETSKRDENSINRALIRAEAACKQLKSKLSKIDNQIKKKFKEQREFSELLGDARILYTKNSVSKEIKDLEGKIKRILALNKELKSLRSKEKPLHISQEELEELIQSEYKIKMLQERLSESGLFVSINPGREEQLSVEVDGNKIDKNQKTTTGIEEVKVAYENLGEVKIRANLQKARDTKVDIEHLQSKVKDTLQQNFVKSIEELKKSFNEQTLLVNEINSCLAEKTGIDKRSIDEIQTKLNILLKKYREYESIKRLELVINLNPLDGDLGELIRRRENELETTSNELNLLRTKPETISSKYEQKKEKMIELRTRLQNLIEVEIPKSLEHQKDLIRKYGSEENQKTILENERKNLQLQKEKHTSINKRHKDFEEGPIARVKNLEIKIENQENIIQQHRASIEQLRGKISESSLDVSYSQISEIQSNIEILEDRLKRDQLYANSIKMLKDALATQYIQTLRSVSDTIKQDVKSYLSYVTENLHDDIELDDNLIPVRLGEQGLRELALEFKDGSSGLKEVLYLCVRLAVAKHLSERDSQCLVLDDPFIHVSNDRSEKTIALINKVVNEFGLQVVILTHRPMEFASFSGKMIDIQSV